MPPRVWLAVKVITNQRISYLYNFYIILYIPTAVAVFCTDNPFVVFSLSPQFLKICFLPKLPELAKSSPVLSTRSVPFSDSACALPPGPGGGSGEPLGRRRAAHHWRTNSKVGPKRQNQVLRR